MHHKESVRSADPQNLSWRRAWDPRQECNRSHHEWHCLQTQTIHLVNLRSSLIELCELADCGTVSSHTQIDAMVSRFWSIKLRDYLAPCQLEQLMHSLHLFFHLPTLSLTIQTKLVTVRHFGRWHPGNNLRRKSVWNWVVVFSSMTSSWLYDMK